MKNIQSEHLSRSIIILFMSMMIAVLPNYSSAQLSKILEESAKFWTKSLSNVRREVRMNSFKSIEHRIIEQKRLPKQKPNHPQFQLKLEKGIEATIGSYKAPFSNERFSLDTYPLYPLECSAFQGSSQMPNPQQGFLIGNRVLPLDSIDIERFYLLNKMDSLLSDFEKLVKIKPYLNIVIEDFDSFGLESYITQNSVLSRDTQNAITQWMDRVPWKSPEELQKRDQLLSLLYLFILKNSAELNSYSLTDLDPYTFYHLEKRLENVYFIDSATFYKVFNEMIQELNSKYYLEYPKKEAEKRPMLNPLQ